MVLRDFIIQITTGMQIILWKQKSFEAFDTVIRKGKEVPRDEKLFIDTKGDRRGDYFLCKKMTI